MGEYVSYYQKNVGGFERRTRPFSGALVATDVVRAKNELMGSRLEVAPYLDYELIVTNEATAVQPLRHHLHGLTAVNDAAREDGVEQSCWFYHAAVSAIYRHDHLVERIVLHLQDIHSAEGCATEVYLAHREIGLLCGIDTHISWCYPASIRRADVAIRNRPRGDCGVLVNHDNPLGYPHVLCEPRVTEEADHDGFELHERFPTLHIEARLAGGKDRSALAERDDLCEET